MRRHAASLVLLLVLLPVLLPVPLLGPLVAGCDGSDQSGGAPAGGL